MDDEIEREVCGVTPPGADTARVREWIAGKAREQGFTDLEWRDRGDKAELTGVRK